MKLNDRKDIKSQNLAELIILVKKNREELSQLRLDKTQNKLKNTRSVFLKRKRIAFILTVIREKELTDLIGKKGR